MTGHQKARIGRVVGDKMDKTVIVAVEWRQRHPLYKRLVRRTTKFYADDEKSACKLGDTVRIVETRRLSHLKRWRVVEILKHQEVPEPVKEVIEEVLSQPANESRAPAGAESTPGEAGQPRAAGG